MRIGSLFSGTGQLDRAVEAVFGGPILFHVENNRAASSVLRARWPQLLNLGDIASINWGRDVWARWPAGVDVLVGGFPCQDISCAGMRAGLHHANRSGLWAHMAHAIAELRPALVFIENVKGLLHAAAHRTLEPGDPDLGERPARSVLRAAGAVLGDLADIGYDARWLVVPASDIGAPHIRKRIFILAHEPGWRWGDPPRARLPRLRGLPGLLPTPRTTDCQGSGVHGDGSIDLRTAVISRYGTPAWARYEPALARWAEITGRPAPYPLEPNTRGNPRIRAEFSEWLLGWPPGWVTDCPIGYVEQIHLIGNGCVPAQAELALRTLLEVEVSVP